jgi:hypothetical protein
MTEKEFSILVKAMKAVYGSPQFIPDKYAFQVWYSLLKDLDYKTVNVAIQRHMTTSRYPPTIADIREQCSNIVDEQEPDVLEAWSLVSKAKRNGIYGAKEEFEKLPEAVKKAVGSSDNLRNWAMMDTQTVESVVQSNFIKAYERVLKRRKELRKMPDGIRTITENVISALEKNEEENTIEDKESDGEMESKTPVPMPKEMKQKITDMLKNS